MDDFYFFTIAIREGAVNSLYESVIIREGRSESPNAEIRVAYLK
jgi:hypothetical protein